MSDKKKVYWKGNEGGFLDNAISDIEDEISVYLNNKNKIIDEILLAILERRNIQLEKSDRLKRKIYPYCDLNNMKEEFWIDEELIFTVKDKIKENGVSYSISIHNKEDRLFCFDKGVLDELILNSVNDCKC